MSTSEIQKTTRNTVVGLEEFEKRKEYIKKVIYDIILSNFTPELGYTEKQIAEKKQGGAMFLLRLISAKDKGGRPALLTVTEESIKECALTYLNGEYDLFKNQGYLFPYGNELKFMVSKDGYVALAKKLNPNIEDFYCDVVYKNDEFEYEKVAGKTIIVKHKQKLENITAKIEDIVCAYATCVFKDGSHIADIMTLQEIYNSLATAQKTISDTHKKNPKIMLSKFPLRRLAKTKIYQSNPDIANIIVDEEVEYEAVDANNTIDKNVDFNFNNEISIPKEKVEKEPIAEIVVEENPFEEFEDNEWTIEEMEEVINEISNEEPVVEVEKPKELEIKTVKYSKWTNELKQTGEWEMINGSWNKDDKTVQIRKKEIK